jgi:hypothetical protein
MFEKQQTLGKQPLLKKSMTCFDFKSVSPKEAKHLVMPQS